MVKTRGHGEGSVCQLKNGKWEGRIKIGYNDKGKPKFKTFTGDKKTEVSRKLQSFIAFEKNKTPANAKNITLGQWLWQWYEDYVIMNLKTSTRMSYEMIIKRHLKSIEHIKLTDLKKVDLDNLYKRLLKNGRVDGKGGLSVKTVHNVSLCLHKALDIAYKHEYIYRNPCDLADVPTLRSEGKSKKEIQILSFDEQQSLIRECSQIENIYNTLIIFALNTGVRLGELLGVMWSDIDYEQKTIKIQRQVNRLRDYSKNSKAKTILGVQNNTKSDTSTRLISINEQLMERLEKHKQWQENKKKKWGKSYKNLGLIFAREDGSYIESSTFRDNYEKRLKKAGLKKFTIHALRHTFASRALELELPIKAVSQILGHSQVQITMDLYQHLLPNVQYDMMNKLGNYIKVMMD